MSALPRMAERDAALPRSVYFSRLEDVRTEIESQFVRTGELLMDAVTEINSLLSIVDALGAQFKDGEVQKLAAQLHQAANDLRDIPQTQTERQTSLVRLTEGARRFGGSIETMQRAFDYLRVISVYLQIGVSGITAERAEFDDLVADIKRFVAEGGQALKALGSDTHQLQHALVSALESNAQASAQIDEMMRVIPAALIQNADAILRHHAAVSHAVAQAVEPSRRVQQNLGVALASLQIGDATRQRVEHVQFGLNALSSDSVRTLPPHDIAQIESIVHRLLSTHLSSMSWEFRQDAKRIETSLSGLAAEAEEIIKVRNSALGGVQGQSESALHALEANVIEASSVIVRMGEAQTRATEIARNTTNVVEMLVGRMSTLQELRDNVQRMVINTAIRSARLGESGKALGVITTELRHHGKSVDETAPVATDELHALAAVAEAILPSDREPSADSHDSLLRSTAQALAAADQGSREALKEMERSERAFADLLRRSTLELGKVHGFGDKLERVAAELLLAPMDAPLGENSRAVLQKILSDLFATYTMASERELHLRQTAELGLDAEATPAPVEEPAADDDDLLF